MELVLPMCNVHPYFSLKNLGKKCALCTAKCVGAIVYLLWDLEQVSFTCLSLCFLISKMGAPWYGPQSANKSSSSTHPFRTHVSKGLLCAELYWPSCRLQA